VVGAVGTEAELDFGGNGRVLGVMIQPALVVLD
jgi:hypothetical protein